MGFFQSVSDVVTLEQAKMFAALYVFTIIPCWVTLFLAVRGAIKRNLFELYTWGVMLFLLMIAPYGYLLSKTQYNSWQAWVAVGLIVAYSLSASFLKRDQLSVSWFWNWYARSYDVLIRFIPYKRLIQEISKTTKRYHARGMTVLEIGCGTGNIASELQTMKEIKYVGIDSSSIMVERAKKKLHGKGNFSFIVLEAENINQLSPNKFGIVIINNVLYAIRDHANLLREVQTLLADDGKIIVSEPLRNSSVGYLIKRHIADGGVKGVLDVILHLPKFIYVFVANLMIMEIEHIKKKNFFDYSVFTQEIRDAGYSIQHDAKVYEEQNILLVANHTKWV